MPRPIALALALWLALGAGCSGGERRVAEARDGALAFFREEVSEVDPGWSAILDHLRRRFGLVVQLADGPPTHGAAPPERADVARVYLRLADPDARTTLRAIAELPTPIDRMTATALHCDRLGLPDDWLDILRRATELGAYGLPDDWLDILRRATELGAYALTHAVVATRWTLENGCLPPERTIALELEQIDALAALVEERHELTTRHELATDIWIEAIAMLAYAGAGERVQPAWIDDLLAAQRPDGGWPNHPDDAKSHPHPTALALWVLLERLEPDAPETPWIPRP